jgi:hypothetical protein
MAGKICMEYGHCVEAHVRETMKESTPISKLTTAILVTALLLPTFYLFGEVKVSAGGLLPARPVVPVSGPDEALTINRATADVSTAVAAVVGTGQSVFAFMTTPAIPAEFAIARPPAFTSRILSGMLSMFGFAAPGPSMKTAPPPPAPTAIGPVRFDFNIDGKADVGRWHSANYEMKVAYSGSSSTATYTVGSSSSAKAAPGDFNGDGSTDAAVFNAGTWTYKTSPTANAVTISLGASGDTPIAGDYDGDGTTDAAVFTPTTNAWTIRNSSTGTNSGFTFGASGDIATNGDFDGDGKADATVYRPTVDPVAKACYWYVRKSSNGATLSIPGAYPLMFLYRATSTATAKVIRPYIVRAMAHGTWPKALPTTPR